VALTLVSSVKVEQNANNTTALVTASFTPAAGELLVLKASNSDASQTFSTPTVSGFTTSAWTQQVNVGTAGASCRAAIWTASVSTSAAGTATLAVANSGTFYHAMVVERWTGWALGTPATASLTAVTTGPWTTTITTQAAGSVVSYVAGDWSGLNSSGVAFAGDTATPTQEQAATFQSGQYTAYWLNQNAASAGANTIGLSAPSGMNITLAAIEIEVAGGGGTDANVVLTPPQQDVTIHV
jgi:hypothetical protein